MLFGLDLGCLLVGLLDFRLVASVDLLFCEFAGFLFVGLFARFVWV